MQYIVKYPIAFIYIYYTYVDNGHYMKRPILIYPDAISQLSYNLTATRCQQKQR